MQWWNVQVSPRPLYDNWQDVEYEGVIIDSDGDSLSLSRLGEPRNAPVGNTAGVIYPMEPVADFIVDFTSARFDGFEGAMKIAAADSQGHPVWLTVQPEGCEVCAEAYANS